LGKRIKEGRMGNRDSASGFGVGFAVGAMLGVALGLLYAPRPGRETRAVLKQRANRVAVTVKSAAVKAKERAIRAKQAAAEKVQAVRG
jgi:gas vesicle protein